MMAALKAAFDGAAARVCESPELGRLTVTVRCDLVGTTRIAVRAGDHLVMVDEPKAFGGGGSAPSPGQLALGALGSCVALTYRLWAARLELDIAGLRVDVDANIDTGGFLGVDDHVRSGFSDVRVTVHLSGPEPTPLYIELCDLANAHCPVLDVFANPVTTSISVETHGDGPGR